MRVSLKPRFCLVVAILMTAACHSSSGGYGKISQLDTGPGLAGIITNHLAIRDDVLAYIRSVEPRTRAEESYFILDAQVMQLIHTLDLDDPKALKEFIGNKLDPLSCAYRLTPDLKRAAQIASIIETISFNTQSRRALYTRYNQVFSGWVFSLPSFEYCAKLWETER